MDFSLTSVQIAQVLMEYGTFYSCSYWVKLRLIKVQQTLPEATVIAVVVIVAVLLLLALLVVTDPILNICGP